jgi:putative flippase GtrA
MGKATTLSTRISRFALAGASATTLHAVIAFLAIRFLSVSPVLGNAAAFLLATAFSYAVQTLWTFEHRPSSRTMGKFGVVVAAGFLCTIAVSGAVERMGYPYWAGIIAVVIVVPPITFLLHNFWTYAESGRDRVS